MTDESCACGTPLHYLNPTSRAVVQSLVDRLGDRTVVTTPDGSWRVPRHYIALHGIAAEDLPELAERYGWERLAG